MKYLVTVEHVKQYTIEISANDEEAAEAKAIDLFERDLEKFELIEEEANFDVEEQDED